MKRLCTWPRLLFGLLVLLALIAFGVWRIGGERPSVPLGMQQRVETTNPKAGIHTRLTDEVEVWKIKRTLEMVREMGAPWIVEYFPWAYIESEPGRYDWTHADHVIAHAHRQGLTVIARLGFVPQWARPKDTTPLYLDEENFDQFADFAVKFVERYRSQIKHVILWNEPNLALEWGYAPPDAAKYTALLKATYPRIKEIAPEMQVLAGALAPTLAPPGDEFAVNDLVFLQQMYDAGAGAYFDILAIHAYGWHFDPDSPADPEVVNFRRTELLRALMVENGDSQKTAMITEGGWNDHPRWTRAVRPAQRILYTLRAYDIAQAEWPWLEAVCLWALRFPWDQNSYQDYFTFVRTDFEPKPIYWEVQRYTRGELP
ncbi:MAG: beta-galactosidase [Caldilinea sp.]|nr:beta-galactosidase [Caldilinea sp.]